MILVFFSQIRRRVVIIGRLKTIDFANEVLVVEFGLELIVIGLIHALANSLC